MFFSFSSGEDGVGEKGRRFCGTKSTSGLSYLSVFPDYQPKTAQMYSGLDMLDEMRFVMGDVKRKMVFQQCLLILAKRDQAECRASFDLIQSGVRSCSITSPR